MMLICCIGQIIIKKLQRYILSVCVCVCVCLSIMGELWVIFSFPVRIFCFLCRKSRRGVGAVQHVPQQQGKTPPGAL